MNSNASTFLKRLAVHAFGVLMATQIVPGLSFDTWPGLIAAALVLGLLNAVVRPILLVLSLPLVVVSLGLFLWVINAALLSFAGWLVKSFHVANFWSALGGAAVISLVSLVGSAALGLPGGTARVSRGGAARSGMGRAGGVGRSDSPRRDRQVGGDDDDGGPIIDV